MIDDFDDLARRFGTPTYVYDLDVVTEAWRALVAALPDPSTVLYSLKANPHPRLARHLRELGAGAEVSSVGELRVALDAGWAPGSILVTGPAKAPELLDAAVAAGCRCSVESVLELTRLARACDDHATSVEAALRVNVDGGPGGLALAGPRSPFGIAEGGVPDVARLAASSPVQVVGVHLFLATNVASTAHLEATLRMAMGAAVRLGDAGVPLRWLDLGGGFPAPYATSGARPDLAGLRASMSEALDAELPGWRRGDPEITFESGRFLAGAAGSLLARVVDTKGGDDPIVVLDTGIHHLGGMSGLGRLVPLRPELVHAATGPTRPTRVVGPLCTSLDCWAVDAPLPAMAPGDLVAVPNVGAYGVSASLVAFLSHDAPTEVVVAHGVVVDASRLVIDRAPIPIPMEDEVTTTWNPEFEAVLRENLPLLEPWMTLTRDAELEDLGMDSLRSIDILVQLEHAFGLMVSDDLLRREVFETAGSLWDLFDHCLSART